jgi:hypothetical protein
MAPRIPSIGSTTVSNSSMGSAHWPRIVRGLCHTISPERRRRGTTPSSRTRACHPRSASRNCAICVLGRRFTAPTCPNARNLSAPQKAELFVGGSPEYIKVDVELWEPQDLQTAMHLARAFERHSATTTSPTLQHGARPSQCLGLQRRQGLLQQH